MIGRLENFLQWQRPDKISPITNKFLDNGLFFSFFCCIRNLDHSFAFNLMIFLPMTEYVQFTYIKKPLKTNLINYVSEGTSFIKGVMKKEDNKDRVDS